MAIDFVKTGSGRTGANHARYIGAEGRYDNKAEVVHVEDFNLHKDTKTAVDFFRVADTHEAQARSGKARSYRNIVLAIPHELESEQRAVEFAKAFAQEVCGKDHAGRLAVHLEEGNWHLHLMFSERKTRNDLPLAENFARGKNNKVSDFASEKWLAGVKARNLEKILEIAPDFKPTSRSEPHIGPVLKNASASEMAKRQERVAEVERIRGLHAALDKVNKQLKMRSKNGRPHANNFAKPSPTGKKSSASRSGGGLAPLRGLRNVRERTMVYLDVPSQVPVPSIGGIGVSGGRDNQLPGLDPKITPLQRLQAKSLELRAERAIKAIKGQKAGKSHTNTHQPEPIASRPSEGLSGAIKGEMEREFRRVWGPKPPTM